MAGARWVVRSCCWSTTWGPPRASARESTRCTARSFPALLRWYGHLRDVDLDGVDRLARSRHDVEWLHCSQRRAGVDIDDHAQRACGARSDLLLESIGSA